MYAVRVLNYKSLFLKELNLPSLMRYIFRCYYENEDLCAKNRTKKIVND